MKIKADWVTCAEFTHSGQTEGEHMMLDSCWNCAPFWWELAVCPTHKKKLDSSSGYCKDCKKFYNINKTVVFETCVRCGRENENKYNSGCCESCLAKENI